MNNINRYELECLRKRMFRKAGKNYSEDVIDF